jgi:hypothetical protein
VAVITIFYKCACMPAERSVDVPPRREDEDIIDWMETCVRLSIGLDHRKRSPLCRAAALEYAKIPAPENAPFIGGVPKTH